ncbi:cytochrome-c peroxidase [Inmirania thermothiophila]|uniref:Cytochrome c peroxidase n=1 Tax=Inmirania thermothiophila TaxID=1750597 RepID=A0A3N1Y7I3_9GAMM|nr:cytochrome c peroxidase [Inmirania thermothiophila]ROR34763.1 cytochrome c peroxidase [Inmirania thermothiophila]
MLRRLAVAATLALALSARADDVDYGGDPITPVPPPPPADAAAEVGRALFADPRLAADGRRSCAGCHDPARAYAGDGPRPAHRGRVRRDVPTLLNAGLLALFGWGGDARRLEEAVAACLEDPARMGTDPETALVRLPELEARARALGLAPPRAVTALAAFLRTLNTPDSPFDRFLRGETTAISEEAREGYHLFRDVGCIHCHNGALAGGNVRQPIDPLGDLFDEHREVNAEDPGLAVVTGRDDDRRIFRVPPLRNVARTPPYYFDGSMETLEEAVEEMAEHMAGIDLTREEIARIVAFLRSLDPAGGEAAR